MSEQTNPVEPMSSEQLMRWARQERNALMADYVRSAAFHLTGARSEVTGDILQSSHGA